MTSYLPTPKSKKPAPKNQPPPKKAEEPASTPAEPASADIVSAATLPVIRKTGMPDWLRGSLTGAYIALVILGGFIVFSFVRTIVFSNGQSINPFSPTANPTQPANSTPTKRFHNVPLQLPVAKPWNGVDRVTILVLGLDARDIGDDCKTHPDPNEPARSDSMLLMSMDPISQTAGVMSIPRDLYVEIPGFGFDRINTAYFDAMANRLPGGGPALAMKTVENLVGIPIDYYAVIDFNAFASMVDEIGGVDVNVPFDNMEITPCGSHVERLFQGKNHLSGPEALAYARNRHASASSNSNGSDFDRSARQMEVILAIRDQVLKNWVTLLPKASTLYNTLSAGIQSNLTFDQYFTLAMIAYNIKKENITQGVVGPDQLLAQETITDAQVLIPNLDKIRELRNKIFEPKLPVGFNAAPPADLQALVGAEQLHILILNGAGVPGLAGDTKAYLLKHGFKDENITTGNSAGVIRTQIIDLTGAMFSQTSRYLMQMMNISPANVIPKLDPGNADGIDLQLILGPDWKIPTE
jgi:polyisoprenyl-teichoic acid--peptidoglycan teichoic acid transferase